MLDKPSLSGLVVEGGHYQQAVGPGPLRVPAQGDGVGRGVGTTAGDDRHPATHPLHAVFDGPHPLAVGHGAGLSGGAADDDRVCAVCKLEVNEPTEGVQIYGVLRKRRDNGHAGAGEKGLSHTVPPIQSVILR